MMLNYFLPMCFKEFNLSYFCIRFTVINPGTDFYHAHIGAQRTMGLYGPLRIRSRTNSTKRNKDPVVGRNQDYTMTVTEWNHNYDSISGTFF